MTTLRLQHYCPHIYRSVIRYMSVDAFRSRKPIPQVDLSGVMMADMVVMMGQKPGTLIAMVTHVARTLTFAICDYRPF